MKKEKDCNDNTAEINVNGGKVKMSYKTAFAALIFVAVAYATWSVADHRLATLEDTTTFQGRKIEVLHDSMIRIETRLDTIIETLQKIETKRPRRR